MPWRLAKSLETLRTQINSQWPNRSWKSDGTIGDLAHQKTESDHNPNKAGVVTAFDITHDPKNGVDIAKLSKALAASRDKRIKYMIRNGEIIIPANGWYWIPYQGDPHTSHLHLSVGGDYDNPSEWKLNQSGVTLASATTNKVTPPKEEVMASAEVEDLKQHIMKAQGQVEDLKANVGNNDAVIIDLVKQALLLITVQDKKIEDLKRHIMELKK